jgi:hypothetical protein
MVISRHTGDFTAMVRAEKKQTTTAKEKKKDDGYSSWRIPSEGVAP